MGEERPTRKPNRRQGQDERGRKKREMPVHGQALRRTLSRQIKPKGFSRRRRKQGV